MKNKKTWVQAALVRAIKTVAQTAIATIGASAGLSGADWSIALSAPVLAGALSLPTSVAGLPEVERHGRRAKDVGQA